MSDPATPFPDLPALAKYLREESKAAKRVLLCARNGLSEFSLVHSQFPTLQLCNVGLKQEDMTESNQKQLGKILWNIAAPLRGAMNADEKKPKSPWGVILS